MRLVVTDGVFSMDGDIAPMPDIVNLAERYGAIVMIDDAHASGVLGKNGRGTVNHFGLDGRVQIQIGTLSKAIGAVGGYVAGDQVLRDYLIHMARPFLFSTSQPPGVVASCIAAIDVLEQEPEIIDRLWENTRFFKQKLTDLGFNTGHSETPITPVIVGEAPQGDGPLRQAVRAGRLRAGHRLPDRGAGAGAPAHHDQRGAHAGTIADGARRHRRGGPRAGHHLA